MGVSSCICSEIVATITGAGGCTAACGAAASGAGAVPAKGSPCMALMPCPMAAEAPVASPPDTEETVPGCCACKSRRTAAPPARSGSAKAVMPPAPAVAPLRRRPATNGRLATVLGRRTAPGCPASAGACPARFGCAAAAGASASPSGATARACGRLLSAAGCAASGAPDCEAAGWPAGA